MSVERDLLQCGIVHSDREIGVVAAAAAKEGDKSFAARRDSVTGLQLGGLHALAFTEIDVITDGEVGARDPHALRFCKDVIAAIRLVGSADAHGEGAGLVPVFVFQLLVGGVDGLFALGGIAGDVF